MSLGTLGMVGSIGAGRTADAGREMSKMQRKTLEKTDNIAASRTKLRPASDGSMAMLDHEGWNFGALDHAREVQMNIAAMTMLGTPLPLLCRENRESAGSDGFRKADSFLLALLRMATRIVLFPNLSVVCGHLAAA